MEPPKKPCSWRSKLRGCWRILTSRYFVCFTYNNPLGQGRVWTSGFGDPSASRKESPLLRDVYGAIQKQDYLEGE